MEILKSKWIELVREEGGRIFFVGGVVRDFLMKRENKDIDILITGLEVEKIISIISEYGKVDEVGKSFGVIKFLDKETKTDYDISLPRKEVKVGEGHKGFEVIVDHNFTVYDDLLRRDFTCNSIALEILDEGVIYVDPYDGIKAIEEKQLVAVNPKTFMEDPLRILRGLQFSARFGFEFEKETKKLMKESVHLISELSGERVLAELEKGLKGDVEKFILLLREFRIFEIFSDESVNLHPFNMFGKPETISEFLFVCLHESIISQVLKFLFEKLKVTNKTLKEVESLLYVWRRVDQPMVIAIQQSLLISDILFHTKLFSERKELIDKFKAKELPITPKDLSLSGQQLMDLGFKGKQIGDFQKEAIKRILLGEIDKDNLLKYAIQKLKELEQ